MSKSNSCFFYRSVCCLALIVFFLLLLPASVSAAERTVKIKDLGIECTIPGSFTYILTRDNTSDADALALGLTKAEINKLLTDSNAYLEAGTEYFETDLRITMVPSTIDDFSNYGDTLLNGLASGMVDSLEAYGYGNITWEIYHHPDTVFLKMEYSIPPDTGYSYSIQYYTVMNLQAINFTCSFQSKPSSSDKAMVKGIVDSAIFENAPKKESEENINYNCPAFNYRDEYVSFRIPDGWHKAELDPNHTHLNAKFQKGDNADVIITYGCQDVWALLSDSERKSLTRSECSFSMMSDKEIKETVNGEYETIGADVKNASIIDISGMKGVQVTFTMHADVYGIPLDVTTTQVAFMEKGYMMTFTISQDPSSKYYEEFKSILKTVTFTFPVENESDSRTPSYQVSTEAAKSGSPNPKTEQSIIVYILCGTALLILGAAIAVVILRKTKNSEKQAVNLTSAVSNDSMRNNDAANQILFCHKCGTRLDEGVNNCQNCGAVIPR